jgi:hypothetical protein
VVRPEHTAHLTSLVGPGHVLRREGEVEGGHGVGPRLGVALDPFGRQLVEVRADRDAQLGPAAPRLVELFVERGQTGRPGFRSRGRTR